MIGHQGPPGDVPGVARYLGVLAPLQQAEAEPQRPRQRGRHRADDDPVEPRLLCDRRHLAVDGAQVGHRHHPGAGIPDLIGKLALGVERVERHHDGAEPKRREVQDREERQVRQAKAEAVARLQAQRMQAARGALHLGTELAIGPAPAEKVDGAPLRVTRHRVIEQVGEQARGEGSHVPRRHARAPARVRHQKWTRPPSEKTSARASCTRPLTRIGVCTAVPA